MSKDYIKLDLAVSWHPCTQMKDHEFLPPLNIVRAKGVNLFDEQDRGYIDAISSWWTNIFGHSHPLIVKAIQQQASTLDHTLFAGITHPPAIELAQRLCELTSLDRCQFSPVGSTAIEIALKQSFQYWLNMGKTRNTFISLEHSYHGETMGALSVSDVGIFTDTYKPLLHTHLKVETPECSLSKVDMTWQQAEDCSIHALKNLLQEKGDKVCAFILEPLVQCASGMRMHKRSYIKRARDLCTEFNIHFIADEISVGFGRTGTMFASTDFQPDFLCLGKAITGGSLPLAATLTTEKVYQAFYDDYCNFTGFLHSHSYTANPICCAASLATLDIFDKEDTIANNIQTISNIENIFSPLEAHPHVSNTRQCGLIWACDITPDGSRNTSYNIQDRKALLMHKAARERGVILRPINSTLYIMPPYVTTQEQLKRICTVMEEVIDCCT